MNNITFLPDPQGIVRLSSFTQAHITDRYISWLNDKAVVRYSEQRHKFHSYESCYQYFLSQQPPFDYFLAIEYYNRNAWIHIGNIGLHVDNCNQHGDMSILIGDRSLHRKGIGTKSWILAGLSFIKFLDLRIITAGTMECNKPMINLFRKSQMTVCGKIPRRFLLDSHPTDLILASGDLSSFNTAYKNFVSEL